MTDPVEVDAGAFARPPERVTHDGYLVMVAPESSLEGPESLHLCVKRTYGFAPDEKAEPLLSQRPFYTSDQYYEGAGPFESALRHESDLGPPKAGTDLVVNAICYAPGGSATHCFPEVQVGPHRRRIIVMGDRVAVVRAGGQPEFTPAEPFSALPVRYELAYGGVDQQHALSPVMCPSNPIGTGYLLQPIDGEAPRDRWTVLPNIEDPDDLLTPDTLLVPPGEPGQPGPLRPPAGFGWVAKHWEPRARLAGMPAGAKPLWRLLHGAQDKTGEHFREMQPDFWSGAPEGLRLPALEGHEKILLRHLHREREELVLRLPIDRPTLRVAVNDDPMQAVALALATVQIEVETAEVILGWRGTLPAPSWLASLEQLERILFEVDGQLTLPAPLIGTGFPPELLVPGQFPPPELLELGRVPVPGGTP